MHGVLVWRFIENLLKYISRFTAVNLWSLAATCCANAVLGNIDSMPKPIFTPFFNIPGACIKNKISSVTTWFDSTDKLISAQKIRHAQLWHELWRGVCCGIVASTTSPITVHQVNFLPPWCMRTLLTRFNRTCQVRAMAIRRLITMCAARGPDRFPKK
jgi:hypothetical protein